MNICYLVCLRSTVKLVDINLFQGTKENLKKFSQKSKSNTWYMVELKTLTYYCSSLLNVLLPIGHAYSVMYIFLVMYIK